MVLDDWSIEELSGTEYSDSCKYSKGNFTSNGTTALKKEHKLYDELNAKLRATGEKCNDNMCGLPECERCAGYKTWLTVFVWAIHGQCL